MRVMRLACKNKYCMYITIIVNLKNHDIDNKYCPKCGTPNIEVSDIN